MRPANQLSPAKSRRNGDAIIHDRVSLFVAERVVALAKSLDVTLPTVERDADPWATIDDDEIVPEEVPIATVAAMRLSRKMVNMQLCYDLGESQVDDITGTCHDYRRPPEAVLRNDRTFWMSTGSYPQTLTTEDEMFAPKAERRGNLLLDLIRRPAGQLDE